MLKDGHVSVYQREKGRSQDKKDSCPSDPCPHKTGYHSQPADTSSLRWGRVLVALGGIVPRMRNVGVGNHFKDLELFRNLFPLISRPESKGLSRPLETLEQ